VALLKRLVLLLIPIALRADALEDAARALAVKIASHLEARETARITVRNLTSMAAPDVGRAQSTIETALRKSVRNPVAIDIAFTVSENIKGYLLIAQMQKGETESVEMVDFKPEPHAGAPVLLPITRILLLDQPEPILDVLASGSQLLVLEPDRLTRYELLESKWTAAESAPLAAPPVRDPRGRIEIAADSVVVFLPGATCRGAIQPLNFHCEPVSSDFTLDRTPVHFTPGRNTIEPADFGDTVTICPGRSLASGKGGPNAPDTIAMFDGATPVSETLDFPGPVTALWPATGGALAVVRNLKTKRYAAYSLSVACGR
jgi:hypothetical protein